jgi:hypothetical protein
MQLLSLIPLCGIIDAEGESILLLLRAILSAARTAMLLAVLCIGLPGLAHAHGGHMHGTSIPSQSVMTVTATFEARDLAFSKSQGSLEAVVAERRNTDKATIGVIRDAARTAIEVVSQSGSSKHCTGGCCCLGMSSCGAGSCCYSSITTDSTDLHFPAAGNLVAHRLYHHVSLLVILGLDRPPKA